jgi:O-antigen/teichoic acid export membrane protein
MTAPSDRSRAPVASPRPAGRAAAGAAGRRRHPTIGPTGPTIDPTGGPAGRPAGRPTGGLAGLARGSLLNLAGAGFASGAGFGVAWLVARGLGPAAAGVIFTALAGFALVAGLAKLGTPTGLVYWIARLREQHRPELVGPCLRAALAPVVAGSLLLAAGLWWAAPWLGRVLGADPVTGTGVLRLLAVFVPLVAVTDAALAATRGYRRMRPTVALDKLLRPSLQLAGLAILAVLALWWSVPLAGWALAWALPYLPALLLAGYAARATHRRYLRRVSAATNRRPPPRPAIAVVFWRFTAPRAVASTLHLALQRLDILLVAGIAGPVAAATYAVAGRFTALGQLANQAIGNAVQPLLAEQLAAGDPAAAGRLYRTATGWLVLTSWPFYLLIVNFATFYLGLFGPAYRAAVPVVVVLAAAMLLATSCGMVDMLLAMAGRTSWNLLNVGLALLTMVGLDLLLVPRLGATGAAIGLAAAVAVNNLLPLAQVGYVLRVHPFGPGTLAAAGLAAGCFGALPAFVGFFFGNSVTTVVSALVVGGAGYLAGAHRLRHRLALPPLAAAIGSITVRPGARRRTHAG